MAGLDPAIQGNGDVALRIILPSKELGQQFMDMADEFGAAGETDYLDEEILSGGLDEYLEYLRHGRMGERLPGSLVPWTQYWAISNVELVGFGSLRPRLSPWMSEFGGHIGYRIRPSARRNGFGTSLLRLMLAKASESGIDPALIVCTPDNVASIALLRKNGAIFERTAEREDGVRLHRFFLPTSTASS
jgi:predicted acetyltransferase